MLIYFDYLVDMWFCSYKVTWLDYVVLIKLSFEAVLGYN